MQQPNRSLSLSWLLPVFTLACATVTPPSHAPLRAAAPSMIGAALRSSVETSDFFVLRLPEGSKPTNNRRPTIHPFTLSAVVLSGRLLAVIGDQELYAKPGDIFKIQQFTPYTLETLGEGPATLYVAISPASATNGGAALPDELKTSWRWVVSYR